MLDSNRFRPVLHNNMKGVIRNVTILDKGTINERIQFDIEVPKMINESDVYAFNLDFEFLESNTEEQTSQIRFYVHKLKSADEDGEDYKTVVPFQVAYAVSIHKAQGLEYDSAKIVITDEAEPVFGQMKRNFCMRRTHVRGKNAVHNDLGLLFLGMNLQRLMKYVLNNMNQRWFIPLCFTDLTEQCHLNSIFLQYLIEKHVLIFAKSGRAFFYF